MHNLFMFACNSFMHITNGFHFRKHAGMLTSEILSCCKKRNYIQGSFEIGCWKPTGNLLRLPIPFTFPDGT
ncbi:unnamed protein product [Haemonchus placei]|uniref:Uncharacterized protein n=1 Tax=Haemonchus placei TaxID=6290 RepID=A0A3P7XHS1_HAEPC|nr:unnamed protein product [Haemonchus placei]